MNKKDDKKKSEESSKVDNDQAGFDLPRSVNPAEFVDVHSAADAARKRIKNLNKSNKTS